MCDSTYMGSLEESHSEWQEVEWWVTGVGEGEIGNYCLTRTEFRCCRMDGDDGSHNNVDVLITTELYTCHG